jgi:hypothetical protein
MIGHPRDMSLTLSAIIDRVPPLPSVSSKDGLDLVH